MTHATDPIVQYRTSDGVLVLSVAAQRLTSVESVARFDRELRALARAQQETRWLIDFGNTTFFITPAVNALLAVLRTLRGRGGRMVLSGISQDVRYVLGLLRVAGVFTMCATAAAGMAELCGAVGDLNKAAEAG